MCTHMSGCGSVWIGHGRFSSWDGVIFAGLGSGRLGFSPEGLLLVSGLG